LLPVPHSADHERVRRSYDEVAGEYSAHLSGELAYKPLDRALLMALREETEHGFPIGDLGCGPGHVSAWLVGHGTAAVGIDLSPEMIAIGRRDYPAVEFREGDLISLPAKDCEFGSIVSLYSIIHLPLSELRPAFAEMRRVLRPGGHLLLAFHAGSEEVHRDEWWGHPVDVTFHFFEPDTVVALLGEAGLSVEARLDRVHYPGEVETQRSYLWARRLEVPEEGSLLRGSS